MYMSEADFFGGEKGGVKDLKMTSVKRFKLC